MRKASSMFACRQGRYEPITADSVEPVIAPMDHDAVAFSRRLAGRSSPASSCP